MFIVQPFFVQGAAMEPNFKDNQYIIVNELGYKKTEVASNGKILFTADQFNELERQAVIVFRLPKNPSQFSIKRVIGLPGEKVEIKDNAIFINGKALDESAYLSKDVKTAGNISATLANDEYFVMGDNRTSSFDSRSYGPIKKSLITGKYWITLFGK